MRKVLLFLCCVLILDASSLVTQFPAARYVLAEFDIDEGYLYNSTFVAFVRHNKKPMERFYRQSIRKSEMLLLLIRGELMDEDLSDLFLYLCVVESGLRMDAHSSKDAKGLWQFMPKTAKAYQLLVDTVYDERNDPVRSTKAAAAYLRHLYERFGKWYLAVLAYNCGEGRLQKALDRAGTDDIEILLDDTGRYLPAQTRDYLRKIVLVAMIGESETIDADDTGTYAKPKVRTNAKKDTHTKESCLISHKVLLGETLESIAAKYQSSVDAIKRINRTEGDMLEVNRLLLIPVSAAYFDTLSKKTTLQEDIQTK
ncbi:Membrane-bound lytic murein transglycosylase D precursor [hydrothermal vent metagenome]|uniref:Membrane-bound lytic murein transglycosylase D n=1 Tax=hydrothermal vent metagenome TaxID=652676 RepID=A0A1W1E7M7_9ZZZZ